MLKNLKNNNETIIPIAYPEDAKTVPNTPTQSSVQIMKLT